MRSLNRDDHILCSHSLCITVLSIFCNNTFNLERNQEGEKSRQPALLGRTVNEVQQKRTVLRMENE